MKARLTMSSTAAALLLLAVLAAPPPAAGQPQALAPDEEAPAAADEPLVLAPDDGRCTVGSLAHGAQKGDTTHNIENGPCSLVCSPTISCSFACIDDNEQQSDCGDYGICDPCKEGIVEIDRVEIGRSVRTFLAYCEHVIHEEVTWQSQNAGCQPFTTCEKDTVGWGVNIDCCEAWGCGGQLCP